MRRMVVSALALAFVLFGVGIGLGQQQSPRKKVVAEEEEKAAPRAKGEKAAPEKSKLEEMLAQALKNNPDIRVAAAKAATAEAELNRTRLQVTQEVVRLQAAITTQQATVKYQSKQLQRYQDLFNQKSIDSRLVDEKQGALLIAKGKLAELEAQLNALLGKPPRAAATDAESVRLRAMEALSQMGIANEASVADALFRQVIAEATLQRERKPAGPMADRIRKALDQPITLKVSDNTVTHVLLDLQKATGITFKVVPNEYFSLRLDWDFSDMPLRVVLQDIEDGKPGFRFVVREYGILFGPREKLPPGAVTVSEFLQQKPTEGMATTSNRDPLPWKVPDKIEGTVKKINPDGSVYLSLNSVDGLLIGHTLHLYRLAGEQSKAKYLGTIRIEYIDPNRQQGNNDVRGQSVGHLTEAPQVGDNVSALMPKLP